MATGKCEVCKEDIAKYKCPLCSIKFCCVACFKSHKESEQCEKPQIAINENSADVNKDASVPHYEFETKDTIKPEKLNLLKMDKNVRESLGNPHLRDMVKYLDSTRNTVKEMEQAMKEPIFVEFVEHCLRVVEN